MTGGDDTIVLVRGDGEDLIQFREDTSPHTIIGGFVTLVNVSASCFIIPDNQRAGGDRGVVCGIGAGDAR